MTRISTMFAVGLVALAGLSATGCCDKEKQALALKNNEYNKLFANNQKLQVDLSKANTDNNNLRGDLNAKDLGLREKDAEIADMRRKLAEKPVDIGHGNSAAEGWTAHAAGDKIRLASDILFSSGRATLTQKGQQAISKIASDLKTTYRGKRVLVFGYTDSDPIRKTKNLWSDNLDLSANRSMAVTRYLISRGIPSNLIETIAMGKNDPIASNSSSSGKAKNRRVDIIVVK